MLKKASLCVHALIWSATILGQASLLPLLAYTGSVDQAAARWPGKILGLEKKPDLAVRPVGIILFASGDGGWRSFETAIARSLQQRGYEVIGIDSARYAQTDYTLEILQADFTRIAQEAEKSYRDHPVPLIVGGYSMGAAQAIAVAGGPHPPPRLVGVLLIDPCSRGRYGLRDSDQMNVLPTGPGTFAVSDFAATIRNLRVVQWHAVKDEIDSRAWLDSLAAEHREFDFPGTGHDYNVDRQGFLRRFADSASWILPASPANSTASTTGLH